MNTNFLKYIVTISEQHNLTKAAQCLFISQPALTKTLSVIEKSLGTQLFKRNKRDMLLTYAGELFVKNAKQILAQEELLLEEMRRISSNQAGSISLGIPGERGLIWLPLLLPAFKKIFPSYKIKVYEGHSSELEEKMLNGTIDISLYTLPINYDKFNYEVINDDVIVIAASKQSEFAKQFNLSKNSVYRPYLIAPEILRNYPFFLVKKGSGTRRIADYIFSKNAIIPNITQEFSRHQTIVKLSALSEQLCITPCITPVILGVEKQMCYFSTEDPPLNRKIVFSYPKDKILTHAESKLIEIAKKISNNNIVIPANKVKVITNYKMI